MAKIFQTSAEAFTEIEDRLRNKILGDEDLLFNLAKLTPADLADVRNRWNEEQSKTIQIQSGTRERKGTRQVGSPMSPGFMNMQDRFPASRKEPILRPLYDPATEEFITEWGKNPEIFDFNSARQEELEGATALLLQAYPDREREIKGLAQDRAKKILQERGQLLPGEDENTRTLLANELARRTSAAAGPLGGALLMDAARDMLATDVDESGQFQKLNPERRPQANEQMNRLTGLSEENRRLFRFAYDNDTAWTEGIATGLGWMGGANALFRRNIRQNYVPKVDKATGLRMVDGKGKALRVEAPLTVNPISRRGLAEGVAYDATVGAALGPEYAPSFMAQLFGIEPNRLSSAIESGSTGLLIGTALRQLSNAGVLRQARNLPEFADVKNASAAEFKKVFRERMPDIFEDMRRAAAERAGQDAARARAQRETASMGGEFVGDVADAARRPEPQFPQAPVVPSAGVVPTAQAPVVPSAGVVPTAEAPVVPLLGAPPAGKAPGSSEETVATPKDVLPERTAKRGPRKSWFGPLPDGSLDLINVIEDMGGIRPKRTLSNQEGGEYDGFAETFNKGSARLLINAKPSASTVDQLLAELPAYGYNFETVDDFYRAVDRALVYRASEKQQMQLDSERDLFLRTALENKGGRRKAERPSATEITPVDKLNVGDKFRIKGEEVEVRDIDPNTGAVIVDDGPRFGNNIELPPGEVVFPDAGSLKKAETGGGFFDGEDFDPPAATPAAATPAAPASGTPAPQRDPLATFAEDLAMTGAADFNGQTVKIQVGDDKKYAVQLIDAERRRRWISTGHETIAEAHQKATSMARDGTLQGNPPVPASGQKNTPTTEIKPKGAEENLKRGDRFMAGGQLYEVWKSRHGIVEAHPVINGNAVVNNSTTEKWAVGELSKSRNPEYRTDIDQIEFSGPAATPATAEIFSADYTGPRFTYGLRNRPMGIGAAPKGFIIGSDGPAIGRARHGTIQYPRQLTEDEIYDFELEAMQDASAAKPERLREQIRKELEQDNVEGAIKLTEKADKKTLETELEDFIPPFNAKSAKELRERFANAAPKLTKTAVAQATREKNIRFAKQALAQALSKQKSHADGYFGAPGPGTASQSIGATDEQIRDPHGVGKNVVAQMWQAEVDAAQAKLNSVQSPPATATPATQASATPAPQRDPSAVRPGDTQNLFSEDEMPFNLTSAEAADSDALLRAEQARRQRERAQGNLFDEPAPDQRTGSSPLTDSIPTKSDSLPDWVKNEAETPAGARLVKGIEQANRKKADFGPRSIINHVNDSIQLEMRRLKSQTSKRYPAFYRKLGHVAVTRSTLSGNYNFHEAGHGLKELLEARDPGFFDRKPLSEQLLNLTTSPGSMASAKNTHEGVAEWMRLRIVNPAAVEGSPITKALEKQIQKFLPGVDAAIRDAARAWERFQRKSALDRWKMLNRDIGETGTLRLANIRAVLGEQWQKVVGTFASGSPFSALDRSIYRATVRNRAEIDKTWREVQKLARQTRKEKTLPLLLAHNNVLNISSEVQNALTGSGAYKGVRIYGPDGNFQILHKKTWNDIRRAIPGNQWDDFQHAGWAKESLDRFEKLNHTYTGKSSGFSPQDLRTIVAGARQEIKDFDKHFDAVQAYFDAVLEVKELGGLKKAGEVERMKARGQYWPLPKILDSGMPQGRGGNHANITAGDRRASGSDEPNRDLNEVAEQRTREAYDRHYWNQLAQRTHDNLTFIATDARLPAETRAIAGRVFLRLRPEMKIAASLSQEEGRKIVYDALVDGLAEQLGVNVDEIMETFRPADINLAWDYKDLWRPTRPSEINVMSYVRGGERVFVQIKDPTLFQYFANNGQAGPIGKILQWALLPMAKNAQRLITQNIIFALLSNPPGDVFNAMVMNRDAISFIPGGTMTLGIWNKFAKKYEQVFDKGLLLSRSEPSSVELINQMRHSSAYRFMTEGLYRSRHPNRLVRWASNTLQPANLLYPLTKLGDIYNLSTAGRYIAPRFESASREGAAVYVKTQGGTDEEAMFAYWNTTGPFNEHPGNADLKILMQTAIFTNPMIMALRRGAQNATDPDPVVVASTWAKLGIIGGVAGASATVSYLTMSDDERKREKERPIEDRISHYSFKGIRLRHPLGLEGAIHSYIYNATMDHWLETDRKTAQREMRLYLQRIASWDGGALRFMGPQISAATEASMNWSNYYQRHIVSPWMSGLPASEQYSAQTPEFYKKLGEWFNYSPDKLQHIMSQGVSRQTDDIIKLIDRMEKGRPIQEYAEIPFVGRAFVRDPIGFGSRSVADLKAVEEKVQLMDARLVAKGWSQIELWPTEIMNPEMQALQIQVQYLRELRRGAARIQKHAEMSRLYGDLGNFEEERNQRVMMVEYAQRLLVNNRDEISRIEQALDQINEMEEAPPEHKTLDLLQRRL